MTNHNYSLITGASQGFGKALSIECAKRRMNLILVSLPGEGLAEFANSLREKYTIDTIVIEKDLCVDSGCREVFDEVCAMDLHVNMLINNAGVGSTSFFHDGSIEQYEKQIRLNVLATTVMTSLFLSMLKKNPPSYILNVGSLASFFSLAKKQVYGATKSYICYFSKSLRRELMHDNVFVSVVCPGGMFTNATVSNTIQTGDYITRASSMKPEDVAPKAINGLLRKKEVILSGRINRAIVFLDGILPRFIVRFFEIRTMKRLHAPAMGRNDHRKEQGQVYPLQQLETEKMISSK